VSKEIGDVHCGKNIALECSGTGCRGRNLGLQYSNRGVKRTCLMKSFLFCLYSSPGIIAVIKFRRWEHDVRMGKRRNVYVGDMRNGGYLED